MSDGPSQRDGFAILMSNATPVCSPNDPWYTAVMYEAHLEHVDESEPLWRVPYFGQVVRADSADENFKARKYEHETDTISKPKDLGFHAVIGMFGADKIAWRVLSSRSGRRSEVQAWANAEEIRLIDAHGGVLRDMDARLMQTLNLTKGGKGDPAAVWAGIEAGRNRALTKFKAAMEKYVAEHGDALVPQAYVDEDKYPLGMQLSSFWRGRMRKGMSDQADIEAWAEALPKWTWDGIEASRRRALTKFKAAMTKYVDAHGSALVPKAFVDADGYPLGERLAHFRRGRLWSGMSDEADIVAWAEALPKWAWDATKTDEWREGRSQHCRERNTSVTLIQKAERKHKFKLTMDAKTDDEKGATKYKMSNSAIDRHKNETVDEKDSRLYKRKLTMDAKTEEEKAETICKRKASLSTDVSKAKRSKITRDRRATELRAELVRARLIAVPFVKSQKRRAEMHAASTNFSGVRGNAVLYMISEDGMTICRVDNRGGTGNKMHVVGPVVDPAPSDAFDSD